MAQRHVRVLSKVGLHARPAALFVQTATKAPMEVTVAKPGKDPVNAKSILAVLGLDVRHGEEITITVEGEGDAERLLDELEAAVNVEAESA
ncbi:HPr family phosphocarrier protein [Thermomonospora catenispora]|uniref:HPr family phosphocarrier protein n=1 Tax=Thermomonospora catenispora TaxID=2493090 RepID=UPI00111CEDCD|nr:HPr family phosphocarrier protein [Thermomonospora catenispora]TNY35532.1 HPr family phosphocarrier protein [Thermomonospora catenispora]